MGTSEASGVKENDLEIKGSTVKSTNERVSSKSFHGTSSNGNTKRSTMKVPPSPNEVHYDHNKKGRFGLTKSLLEQHEAF